jgi:3-hydroxyacyl-CoA dehydrogenase / 3-hydroxy-2-methylbutyryl-CoA dehydrogenase
MSLAHRIALVTGAASGLGKATALRLAKAGARVAIVDLPSQPGADVAKQIGDRAISLPTDVTSEEQVKAALDAVQAKWGSCPNAVVQCAGIGVAARVLGKKGPHPLDQFAKVLTVNTVGTFNVLRLAAERMAASTPADGVAERGVIINTASIAAFEGQVGQAAYSASKGAVVGMMLPIARELAKSQIRVNTVAPGLFLTPLLEGLPPKVQVRTSVVTLLRSFCSCSFNSP